MWIWDGSDSQEGDGKAAFADTVRRAMISTDPAMTDRMRAYVAAFSLVLTGRNSHDLRTPEPLIQGGFTPSDNERHLMCETVRRNGRDLIHICFRTVEPFTPTGLIVVVYLDGEAVRLHSRTSLIWVAKDGCVRLYGVEDEPDLNCHFTFHANEKLVRRDGFPTPAGSAEMKQAADRVQELIRRNALGDIGHEPLAFHHSAPTVLGGVASGQSNRTQS